MEKMTIKDIAKLVGVSTATVSNYLNGNLSKMSPATQKKIADMIRNTNYVPSSVARGLATNDSKTIGVSVADITNPFTSTVLSGIYEECGKHGYRVLFTNASSDASHETDNISKLQNQQVSGLIIDPVEGDSPIYKTITNRNAVMIDRQAKQIKVDTVVTDNFDSVKRFVSKMLDEAYDVMYYVSWPLKNVSTRWNRYNGFLAATGYVSGTHYLSVHNTGDTSEFLDELTAIMKENAGKKVGFFTMNGRVLIRLLAAMEFLGLQYPIDYGVGSYEDLDWMSILKPAISCISQDSYAIGTMSAQILLNKLDAKSEMEPRLIEVPTSEKIRGSF
ncbi:LacI family DNA-binding transcriptional regulator [Lentilactobacillus sunkii]|uniref:Transcriptional regulator n=1 Tax=Lentilactobacillus sunkii DSM 19904 TaxID=1423808 RepID=A0A0R1L8D4_9LACO|nr:LacI family DNA-binding transcriptional regulator [Lentilactobacillus sunkii]KRK88698.1 transcriptional regulator [Lentilactobacillus sunkii DSM 19904]